MLDNNESNNNKKLVQLHTLNKGDCFIFNGLPYKIDRVFWENLGMMKRKIYVCKMKFAKRDDAELNTVGTIEVYKISRNLYNMLVPDNVEKCREQWIRILSL